MSELDLGAHAVEPLAEPPDAVVSLPGSKSLTNRAVLAASLASGRSDLRGALDADDTQAMLGAVGALGAEIRHHPDGRLEVVGCSAALAPGPLSLDARLSGTTARFVMPALALGGGPYLLDGDPGLRLRPMADGIAATRALGADVRELGAEGHLPVEVRGTGDASSTRVVSVRADASSQFLSGLLIASAARSGATSVEVDGEVVSRPYVSMTVDVLEAFGSGLRATSGGYELGGGLRGTTYEIEPDASAASYFFAAAAICGGRVRVEGLGEASSQGDLRFVDVLERMGAEVLREPDATTVVGGGSLTGVTVDLGDMSDTAQTLAAVAAFADGPTEVTGIGFIRAKETDRIGAVVAELVRCGVGATETPDGFRITPGAIRPTLVRTYGDHRMAMSFALLGLRAPGIRIADPGCVDKTFPRYFEVLEELRSRPSPTG